MTNELTSSSGATTANERSSWRTVDIVVAAVVAVAFGVVFAGWNALWVLAAPAFAWFPPAQALMYGLWLAPGVLGGLLIRKRGAAFFTELVAASVSALFPATAPAVIVLYGLLQALAAEAVFAAFRYRSWRLPTAMLAGGLAGVVPAVLDPIWWYAAWAPPWQVAYGLLVVVSSILLAGLGAFGLVRALARTGVLAPFASGREQSATS
jgi:energy-coupling factor transport system permease protein